MHVLVCGGGVIGASVAYFLSCRGVKATVIESTGLACAASGKSGGFLARDWCDGSPLAPLACRSFALHAELAEKIADDWGYRRLDTYGGLAGVSRPPSAYALGWLSDAVTITQALGSPETTAQVHPGQFTAAMMRAAEAQGAQLRHGRVSGITKREGRATGVEVDGAVIEGDAIVIAMGPWSILAASWLPLPPVFGLKGHSLVFETGTTVPGEAVFSNIGNGAGRFWLPSCFRAPTARPMYARSPARSHCRSIRPGLRQIPAQSSGSRRCAASISPVLASAKILAWQACYRPVTRDGLPLIGTVPEVAGAYVATGHSVWGILNAPATGEAMAELIVDGAAHTADLNPFNPGRLPAFDPARLRMND